MSFIVRGFIWDIPILIFAYVLFWGPTLGYRRGCRLVWGVGLVCLVFRGVGFRDLGV